MEKTSSQNINEKDKLNKKLELDYSLYLESMYVILYFMFKSLENFGRFIWLALLNLIAFIHLKYLWNEN